MPFTDCYHGSAIQLNVLYIKFEAKLGIVPEIVLGIILEIVPEI